MKLLRGVACAALAALIAACSPAKQAAEPAAGRTVIRFATDWRAQAEQGGFYAAVAEGEYARRGLDVQQGPGARRVRLAVDALDARGAIAERRINAGLPQIGRFEDVGVGRENQGRHRQLLSLDQASALASSPSPSRRA